VSEPSETPEIAVVAGIILEGGRVLVARRLEHQSFGGHWEFPGGKVEAGESPEAALEREFQEELGIGVRVLAPYHVVRYRNRQDQPVRVDFFRAERRGGEPRLLEVAEVRWADAAELGRLRFIPANEPVVAKLAAELEAGAWG
jgi:mutator protein MutT